MQQQYEAEDKDEIISKLRSQNVKLREKLKEMSYALDQALEKAQKKLIKKENNFSASADDVIRQKDMTIAGQTSKIQGMRKEIDQLRARLDAETGYSRMKNLENELADQKRINNELSREIKSLNNIQTNQSKALTRISNQNEYAEKIKELMDEVKTLKEKNSLFQNRLRKDEKQSRMQQDHMVKLQERVRDMKDERKGGESGEM